MEDVQKLVMLLKEELARREKKNLASERESAEKEVQAPNPNGDSLPVDISSHDQENGQSLLTWEKMARPEQKIPHGDWRIWLIMAGRGFGKTRTGAETIQRWASENQYKRLCLLGHHWDDVRSVMIEGESGILAVSQRAGVSPTYYPSKRLLVWPNGAQAMAYSADTYDQLRGPQFDAAWVDELAKFSYPQRAWDQLMMCLRLGSHPRVIVTTTPRPLGLLRTLQQRPDVHVTQGSTWDNAHNLSPAFLENITSHYANTPLGVQEIEGCLASEGTLWSTACIRVEHPPLPLVRVVIAIDPAVSCNTHSSETGIIVAGMDSARKAYILDDLSGHYTPQQWIQHVVKAYHTHKAQCVVVEINNGGDVIKHAIRQADPSIRYVGVHAKFSKQKRLEPIMMLYAQDQVSHARSFPVLMEHMADIAQRPSDRVDALVWALDRLFFHKNPTTHIDYF